MDVRIGIIQSAREIAFETDQTADEVTRAITDATSGENNFVSFSDVKGATFLINVNQIAYLEVGADTARRVGFVS